MHCKKVYNFILRLNFFETYFSKYQIDLLWVLLLSNRASVFAVCLLSLCPKTNKQHAIRVIVYSPIVNLYLTYSAWYKNGYITPLCLIYSVPNLLSRHVPHASCQFMNTFKTKDSSSFRTQTHRAAQCINQSINQSINPSINESSKQASKQASKQSMTTITFLFRIDSTI